MIQQQYYTRYKKGLYSNNPGFDTVAKSRNLEDEFIKSVLHPLCIYEAPSELIGEEDISKYPKALYCVNCNKKMIIGQAVFCGKDYSGNRNTYFVHNYIIPEDEKCSYIEDPNKIIYMDNFKINWDFDFEKNIEEVKETGYSKEDKLNISYDELKKELKIRDERFKQIILACKKSVESNRKVYIIIDVQVSLVDKYARELLKYIYSELTGDVREKFGFITYTKSPISVENINLMFLNKGSIKKLTTEIKAGFLFDFAEDNFYIDGLEEDTEYELNKKKFEKDGVSNLKKENKFLLLLNKIIKLLKIER